VHDGVVRATNYALTLRAAHVEALYLGTDPEGQPEIVEDWWHSGIQIPLSLVEAPFRDFAMPLLEEVRRHTASPGTVVTVVIPEFLVSHWWEQPLHGQTALFMKRLLLTEPYVTVTNVPYHLAGARSDSPAERPLHRGGARGRESGRATPGAIPGRDDRKVARTDEAPPEPVSTGAG
jgi:hypothetical protein